MNELAELTYQSPRRYEALGPIRDSLCASCPGRSPAGTQRTGRTLDDTSVTVGIRSEWASHAPFGAGLRSRFEPHRVALESPRGEVLEELREPRASFAGHTTPRLTRVAIFVECLALIAGLGCSARLCLHQATTSLGRPDRYQACGQCPPERCLAMPPRAA
jgi:hypothetical protein